jgi:hypothetical protein
VRLYREPIGLDGLAQKNDRQPHAQLRNEQIAQQVPAPAQHDVDNQDDCEAEHAEERRPPERTGPAENCHQRLLDLAVLSGRCRRDHGGQADHDRREEQRDRVDRSPVATAWLGFGQQLDVPGAAGRRGRLVLGLACCRRQDRTDWNGLITTARTGTYSTPWRSRKPRQRDRYRRRDDPAAV